MPPFTPLTLTPSSDFNTQACQAIEQALEQNTASIQRLTTPETPITTRYLSHHIKVNHADIHYIDVLYDQESQRYALLIKKKEHQHHKGFYKKVCTQFLLTFDEKTHAPTTTAVVSIKAKDVYHENTVTHEAAEQDGVVFTCISSNKPDAKRVNQKRAIQTDLGAPLHTQLQAVSQLEKTLAASTVCKFMVQVGTQLAYYNLTKRKTHFDLHVGNILCKTPSLGKTQNIENFTIIDYPTPLPTCQGGVDTEPSKLFYYDDLNDKVDVGYGIAAPIIAPWPDMFGWREFGELLAFLDLNKATIKKFSNIALTGEGKPYKIHGLTADSFGYLRGLYALIQPSKELTTLFKPFLQQQLLDLLQTSHKMPKQLPKHLTSLGMLQSFIMYCKNHSELKNLIATQLALPAVKGWQTSTKTLLSPPIAPPSNLPLTTRKNQKPNPRETFEYYIETLNQESTELASEYFSNTKAKPLAQKITDLYSYMEQISQQITAYHNQHNATHFHVLSSQVTTHLADGPKGGKVRKFTLLTPSYLNQANAAHLPPETLYDYDTVHKQADQQWGVSSPFIKPWPDMNGWGEYQDLLLFLQVDANLAKKYGNIALTGEGDEYQTSGYMIDSYGYLFNLYSLIKDDPQLSKLFQPFLQQQMLDVITTSHKHPQKWPERLKPHNIMVQFKKYCQNTQPSSTHSHNKTQPHIPQPLCTRKPIQETKELISKHLTIGLLTIITDFFAWLFTGRKTTLSLKKQLLDQLSQVYTATPTPKNKITDSQECLDTLRQLIQRCPHLDILIQAPLHNLKIQLETKALIPPSPSSVYRKRSEIKPLPFHTTQPKKRERHSHQNVLPKKRPS